MCVCVCMCVCACVCACARCLNQTGSRQISVLISTLRWICVLWALLSLYLDCAGFEKEGTCIWYCMRLKQHFVTVQVRYLEELFRTVYTYGKGQIILM